MSEIPDAWHVAPNAYQQPREPRPYGASPDWQPEKKFDHKPPEITPKLPYPTIDYSKLPDWMQPKTEEQKEHELAVWHAEAARQIEKLYGTGFAKSTTLAAQSVNSHDGDALLDRISAGMKAALAQRGIPYQTSEAS